MKKKHKQTMNKHLLLLYEKEKKKQTMTLHRYLTRSFYEISHLTSSFYEMSRIRILMQGA